MKMFYVDKVCKAFGVRMVTDPQLAESPPWAKHSQALEGHLVTYPRKGPGGKNSCPRFRFGVTEVQRVTAASRSWQRMDYLGTSVPEPSLHSFPPTGEKGALSPSCSQKTGYRTCC